MSLLSTRLREEKRWGGLTYDRWRPSAAQILRDIREHREQHPIRRTGRGA